MGFGRMAVIPQVCMRDISANSRQEEYHPEITLLKFDSLVHSRSRNAYTRSSWIEERGLYAVYLFVHLSIHH